MSGKRIRSGKQLESLGSHKQREHEPPKESKKVTPTREDAIGNCRNVRGLEKSMVVFRFFEKIRY